MSIVPPIGVLINGLLRRLVPNSLRVLAKIDGLLEDLAYAHLDKLLTYSVVEGDRLLLARDPPRTAEGFGIVGLRRSALNGALVDAAARNGVEIKWGHSLLALRQGDDSVTTTFENGVHKCASFVIGCDGMDSTTRDLLFGTQQTDFTGIVQVSILQTL